MKKWQAYTEYSCAAGSVCGTDCPSIISSISAGTDAPTDACCELRPIDKLLTSPLCPCLLTTSATGTLSEGCSGRGAAGRDTLLTNIWWFSSDQKTRSHNVYHLYPLASRPTLSPLLCLLWIPSVNSSRLFERAAANCCHIFPIEYLQIVEISPNETHEAVNGVSRDQNNFLPNSDGIK